MGKEKHKMTDAELYYHEFEQFSKDIVDYLFHGVKAQIIKTKPQKDGGYDIIVECCNSNVYQKVYFECKLRSENLNLRDIAANIIIAFNEGAVAFVAITNYDYTEQANENIKNFYQKTILNIKVIIGEDIRKIIYKNAITVPPHLDKLICSKKTRRKKTYDFLRLNLDSTRPYEKILEKNINHIESSETFVTKYYANEISKIRNSLEAGETVCVEGFSGLGKSSIIDFCLQQMSVNTIRVTADNYLSQSELLLSLFMSLWGIPISTIFGYFSEENIDNIISVIKEKSKSEDTGEIIKKLLAKNSSEGIANEHYNYLICQYLIHNIKIHCSRITYVFYIENVSKASEEIQQLLIYICKLLKKNTIACILEKDIVEYQWQYDNASFFGKINYQTISIKQWSDDDAQKFVDWELKEYPERFRKAVLNRGGTRLLTLSLIIEFCREKSQNNNFVSEVALQQFEPNEIPSSIECLIKMYFEKAPELFCFFYFTNGKIPIEWSFKLLQPYQECLDHLLNLDFMAMDDSYIWVKGELILEYIQNLVSTRSFLLRNAATNMLSVLAMQNSNEHLDSYIYIYDSLKEYNKVSTFLKTYMTKLYRERQYHSFLKWADYVFDKKVEIDLTTKALLDLITHILIVWRIKREINGERATWWIQQMQDLLSDYVAENKDVYQMILDCFFAERYFQNCDFEKALKFSHSYYQSSLKRNIIYTDYEWQEKICIIYALCLKEQKGNAVALKVFENLIEIYPQSFFVQIEYWDHLECINFYKDPKDALECVNKVLDKFKDTPRYDYSLPYHEYVDRAMCALCAKDFNTAMQYSNEAINILESNGILPSLGRAYNIMGCIYLCQKNIEKARNCFKDSKYLLDESKEYLYSWRSGLNLITIELIYKTEDTDVVSVITMLNEVYKKFKEIYTGKMQNLIDSPDFFTCREYFALLMFQHAFCLCGCNNNILEDFTLRDKSEMFLKHFKQLKDKRIKNADFSDCAYANGKYLFMVG